MLLCSSSELGQAEGWSPIALSGRQLAQARSLLAAEPEPEPEPSADLSGESSAEAEDSVPGEDGEEDRQAEDSHLAPLYAPAPAGYGAGYGPYIYIVPIVLPAVPPHRGPAPHVVTETGHESHHYRAGPAPFRPVYPGSYGGENRTTERHGGRA